MTKLKKALVWSAINSAFALVYVFVVFPISFEVYAQTTSPAAGRDGDSVTLSTAVVIGLIVSVVVSLAGTVTMLYKAQTAGHERVVAEVKNGYALSQNILAERVNVLTGRESTLLAMVGDKDKYVLEVLSGVVTSVRDGTMKHDATMVDLIASVKESLKESQAIARQTADEHRLILEAIKDNGERVTGLTQAMKDHEANQALHRGDPEHA